MNDTLLSVAKSLPSDLEHYGVKGMKWGVRKSTKPSSKRAKRKAAKKASHKTSAKWNKKYQYRESLSDKDLERAVRRLQLENQFAREVSTSNAMQPKSLKYRVKSSVAKGGDTFVNNVATNAGKKIGSDVGGQIGGVLVKTANKLAKGL